MHLNEWQYTSCPEYECFEGQEYIVCKEYGQIASFFD